MGAAAYASSVGKNEGSPSRKSGNNRCGGTRTQPPSRSNASRQALCVFIKTLPEPASRTGLDGPSWQVGCCTSSIHDGSGARLRHPDSGRSQLVHQLRAGGLQPGPRLLPACVAGGAARGALGLGSGLRAAALRLAGRLRASARADGSALRHPRRVDHAPPARRRVPDGGRAVHAARRIAHRRGRAGMSFALAGMAFGARAIVGGPVSLLVLFGYVGAANLVIAVFNLLPGYPLDGGRLVRASLWAWRGSFDWATRVASMIGRVTGLMLAGFGAANAAASGELISGLWLVLVGIFVHQSARAAGRHGQTRQRRAPVQVEAIGRHVR